MMILYYIFNNMAIFMVGKWAIKVKCMIKYPYIAKIDSCLVNEHMTGIFVILLLILRRSGAYGSSTLIWGSLPLHILRNINPPFFRFFPQDRSFPPPFFSFPFVSHFSLISVLFLVKLILQHLRVMRHSSSSENIACLSWKHYTTSL